MRSTLSALCATVVLITVLLAGCFGAAETPAADTDVTFASPQVFSVGLAPTGLDSADINADGKPDLLVANQGSNTVSVMLNGTVSTSTSSSVAGSPSPSPSPATVVLGEPYDYTAGSAPVSVAASDIDSDGRPDIVVGCSDGTVGVLLNTSATGTDNPTFSRVFTFQSGGRAQTVSVACEDINGDGRPDIFAANAVDNTVGIFLNTTVTSIAPTFVGPYPFGSGTAPQQVVVRDINGDDFLDLVTPGLDGRVTILLGSTESVTAVPNPPAPTFIRTYQTEVAGGGLNALVVADFDNDGRLDVTAACGSGNAAVFANATSTASATPTPDSGASAATSDPSAEIAFETPLLFGLNGTPAWLVEGTFAAGGKHDLAAPIASNNNVSVLVNRSTATAFTFADGGRWDAGAGPVFALPVDVDGDGRTDLVVSDQASNQVAVLINLSTASTSGAVSSPTVSGTASGR